MKAGGSGNRLRAPAEIVEALFPMVVQDHGVQRNAAFPVPLDVLQRFLLVALRVAGGPQAESPARQQRRATGQAGVGLQDALERGTVDQDVIGGGAIGLDGQRAACRGRSSSGWCGC